MSILESEANPRESRPMTTDEALDLLRALTRQSVGTYDEHVRFEVALKVLTEALAPTVTPEDDSSD